MNNLNNSLVLYLCLLAVAAYVCMPVLGSGIIIPVLVAGYFMVVSVNAIGAGENKGRKTTQERSTAYATVTPIGRVGSTRGCKPGAHEGTRRDAEA